jgi:sRNA-binding protein
LRELLDPINPRPLAIGIHAEIADRLVLTADEQRRLRRPLAMWVGRPTYLKTLRDPGAVRHDLDGNSVERVSREHEIAARQRLFELRVRRARRREAEARRVAKAAQRRANADKPVLRLFGGTGQ